MRKELVRQQYGAASSLRKEICMIIPANREPPSSTKDEKRTCKNAVKLAFPPTCIFFSWISDHESIPTDLQNLSREEGADLRVRDCRIALAGMT